MLKIPKFSFSTKIKIYIHRYVLIMVELNQALIEITKNEDIDMSTGEKIKHFRNLRVISRETLGLLPASIPPQLKNSPNPINC